MTPLTKKKKIEDEAALGVNGGRFTWMKGLEAARRGGGGLLDAG